jgi:DNA-directed RNA polymerase omega subunit
MEDKRLLFDVKIEQISKYEMVILTAKRAREINDMRLNLEKKHLTRLIEKDKPTVVAMHEVVEKKLIAEYPEEGQKPMMEQPQRGLKKTV